MAALTDISGVIDALGRKASELRLEYGSGADLEISQQLASEAERIAGDLVEVFGSAKAAIQRHAAEAA